jgi:glycosyltransferase involved in cell wall biosynthesis
MQIRKYYQECLNQAGSSVSFLPYTAGDELKRLLRSHRVLIIPSHFESFSLVGWEAASQGMHVLYNDVADMNETLAPVGIPIQIEDKASAVTAITAALNGNLEQKKSHDLLSSRSWDTVILALLEAYA